MKRLAIVLSLVVGFCAFAGSVAVAQVGAPPKPGHTGSVPNLPQVVAPQFSFQGRLTTALGAPVNDPVQVMFRLYPDVDPGIAPTAVWTSSVRVITPTQGLFTVLLGDVPDVPTLTDDNLAAAGAIGVQVLPDPEMTPRQPIQTIFGHTTRNHGAVVGGVSGGGSGVVGVATTNGTGVEASSQSGRGVLASTVDGKAIQANATGTNATAVYASSNLGNAITAYSYNAGYAAIYGQNDTVGSSGVWGQSATAYGVSGHTSGNTVNAVGVYGDNGGTSVMNGSYAGFFNGHLATNGNFNAPASAVLIDHPLNPANQYLNQPFVSSSDMLSVDSGNVTTNAKGQATVQLPGYVEALNGDFRYQLTVIGQFAQAIVATEIKGNQFAIMTDKPNVKVSWQVTGVRKDPYAQKNAVPAEQDKPANLQGTYLNPELYGQPASKGQFYGMGAQAPQGVQP